jgi:hypothetical protein
MLLSVVVVVLQAAWDMYGSKKPIFTDRARWYNNDACKWLRLPHHQVYGTGTEHKKNLMEKRFIQHIIKEDRTKECFDDPYYYYFPCRKSEDCNRQQHVWNWLKLIISSTVLAYGNG